MDEQYSLDADSLMFHQPFVSIRVNKQQNAGALRRRYGGFHFDPEWLNSYK